MKPTELNQLIEYIHKDPMNQIRLNLEQPQLITEAIHEPRLMIQLRDDPILFTRLLLGINPTSYQVKLLKSTHPRVHVCWPRQSGKTRTLAALSIWHAAYHPDHTILIVAPSERQSINLRDQIHTLLGYMPKEIKKTLIKRSTRTRIYYRNGSRVIALPNSPDTIRGYRAHLVILDEAAFFQHDEQVLRHTMIPMLATTRGRLILSSTPWGKNSIFYQLSKDPEYQHHHITWKTPLEEGVYTPEFKTEIQRTMETNPLAYQTEYMADFIEEADTWLTTALLTKAINPALEYLPYDKPTQGMYYMGIDLAERVDHSAIAVIHRTHDKLQLVHLHKFPIGEPLTTVIGYTKILATNWRTIHHTYIDNTRHGDHIINDFQTATTPATGITFTHRNKMHMAMLLKTRLTDHTLQIPYHRDTLIELNTPTYHPTRHGTIQYDHPQGTHDDAFWATALAITATEENTPHSHPMARTTK